ncbi:MAG: ABC-2 transporter permease [Clostridiales bacterium]|jgi:hypothetical protein|nr:ABC-2 transporter permease [Clostridiales bacterium]
MTDLTRFVKLDFLTVKASMTLKNLVLFAIVGIVMNLQGDNSMLFIAYFLMFTTVFVTTAFFVSEKNNIYGLYATLSISRPTVIRGRYLFALIADVCGSLFAFLLSFVIITVRGKPFDFAENLTLLGGAAAVFTLVQAVQMPIFFKLGYTKAKLLAYIPLAVFPAIVAVAAGIIPETWIGGFIAWLGGNAVLAGIIGGLLWLLAVSCSIGMSQRVYSKRDF